MKITRLSWAGLMLESATTTIYIDPLQYMDNLVQFSGEPKFPILNVPFATTPSANALVTHIHPDHFDTQLLSELIGSKGIIVGPDAIKALGAENGLAINGVKLYETFTIGDFQITPVPAVDWIGDDQVSYVISDGKHTIIHGGDTNWHGWWWPIARQFGPFDLTFLPVNGVVGQVPGVIPFSDMHGTMTPDQAVTATRILGSKTLVPMHYALFHNPPAYIQFPDLENELTKAGETQDINIHRLKDGETITL
jgi:L-ascorbate metabolism protein UlaG (beta-lactamase superfamily)